MVEAIRFFRVVPPVPSLMTTGFAIVTLVSIAVIAIDASHTRGTLTAVIVLQAFASSSGFAGHARRGHYDLLLTRGVRRSVIAVVHWLMSSLPGIASWILVSAAEVVATGAPRVGFASGTAVAVTTVSTLAWTLTVPFPRFTGAIAWLVAIVMGVAVMPVTAVPTSFVAILYPPAWIGSSIGRDPVAAGSALSVAAGAVVLTLLWSERGDIPLEAAQ